MFAETGKNTKSNQKIQDEGDTNTISTDIKGPLGRARGGVVKKPVTGNGPVSGMSPALHMH
jgi:hypothetical protein